jgi:glycosyltransferase involved in cell wall biosynthesis
MAFITSALNRPDVMVDRTHMGRRASGIERITDALFSARALAPLEIDTIEAPGRRWSMVLQQMLMNPLSAVRRPELTWIFPGYPPSPAFRLLRERTLLYVHDLFLLTRKQDLNWAARLYMAPTFRIAIRTLRYFLVNSVTTQGQLAQYVRDDARVQLYRPCVQNVFGLLEQAPRPSAERDDPLIIGALGTVEPRKNFLLSAQICEILSKTLQRPVQLHIIGRAGWGGDFEKLSSLPHVTLHGFLSDDAARGVIANFDLFLCTSHDEGLGLPLLEVQYAGLPVVAPEQEVFREVLGNSGTFVATNAPERAAATIASLVQRPDWRTSAAALAHANVKRWNRQSEMDRSNVVALLMELRDRERGR